MYGARRCFHFYFILYLKYKYTAVHFDVLYGARRCTNRETDGAAFCRRKSEAFLQKASIARRNERNLIDAERFSERN